jgi:hypothetical protein
MANNVPVLDGAEVSTTMKTTDTAGVHVPHVNVDSSALPTGAATAANQDTANTALAAIETAVEILDNAISGNEMQVDIVTSALPSGASTAANQTTIIGHLDGVEGILTTIDADTGGILTAVQILDNAISGNEMQVDVVAALPAGDNNIGNVDIVSLPALAAGTNNIGDVDVLSIVPGTGATNLGKAEDAAHASGDTGVMMLAVRKDTAAASSGTTGDYEPLQTTAVGALRVSDVDSVPLSSLVSGVLTNTDGASTQVIAAQGSGVITYLTDIVITNSSEAAVVVELKDGTTVKWRANIPAGLGISQKLGSPLVGTANTAWNLDAASATTTIYATLSGFKV